MTSLRRLKSHRVRLYDQVRTAHLERAHELAPAAIVYRAKRYDFDAQLAVGLELVHAGALRAARMISRSATEALEVNEPLYLASLPRTALVIAALRARALISRRRRPLVVTYAIENRDPFADTTSLSFKTRLRRHGEAVLARYVWKRVDRVAFGTGAALALYGDKLPDLTTQQQILLPALPQACGCSIEVARDSHHVVFVGDLSPRKGIRELLAAWPLVREACPTSTLTVMGKGALLEEVAEHVSWEQSMRLVVDPPRAEIHRELRRAQLLVLPSQRMPQWREQVGLPIVEALAHGCSVVTTTQTGIADWLQANGHGVVDPGCSADQLAQQIADQLDRGASAAEVLSALPHEDGRLTADRWLFGDADSASVALRGSAPADPEPRGPRRLTAS